MRNLAVGTLVSYKRQRHTEAYFDVGHRRRVAVAVGRRYHARIIEPGAAAEDPPARIAGFPGAAVSGRAVERRVPAILHPFRQIAGGVEHSEAIGGKGSFRRRPDIVPAAAAAIAGGPVAVRRLAPPEAGDRAGAAGIFVFRLALQAIGLAGFGGQPGDVALGVVPADIHHRAVAPAPAIVVGRVARAP